MKKINIDELVIFENNHYIVCVKPEGVLSQEDATHDADMVNLLKEYLKNKYSKVGNVYLGLVHRLDRRVSGVMVFGKTTKGSSRLSESIRNKTFKKTYFAIATGLIKKSGVLSNKLDKVYEDKYIAKESIDGKDCILEYTSLCNFKIDNEDFTLLKINLLTGRFNQIRMQFSLINHPLINDFKYGYNGKNYNDHLGLFCVSLAFPDPVTKEIKEYKIDPKFLPFKEYINYEEYL